MVWVVSGEVSSLILNRMDRNINITGGATRTDYDSLGLSEVGNGKGGKGVRLSTATPSVKPKRTPLRGRRRKGEGGKDGYVQQTILKFINLEENVLGENSIPKKGPAVNKILGINTEIFEGGAGGGGEFLEVWGAITRKRNRSGGGGGVGTPEKIRRRDI